MSEGHNDNGAERTNQGAANKPHERVEPESVSYYYDDSTNYETYCEDNDDEQEPADEGTR